METATIQSCRDCAMRSDRLFCDLPADALAAFDNLKNAASIPRGTVLFREGQAARGVFVLCDGKVRISVCSESGKRLTLRTAGPGEVMGLSAALSGCPHEVTVDTIDDCQVAMVKRKELLRFLREHREACLQVVNLLSQDLHIAYERVRSVGLGRTRRPRLMSA